VRNTLKAVSRHDRLEAIVGGLVFYYFTTAIVILGVVLSVAVVLSRTGPQYLDSRMARQSGQSYRAIAERGYFYDPNEPSNVALFPAYPLLGRWLVWATGMRTEMALVAVSNACLAGAFILLRSYAQARLADGPTSAIGWTLVAFGIMPTTFFFRMAESESLFLLVAIGAMYAMQRRAHPCWVALIVGLATATRPVGILLLGPFALYLWQRMPNAPWRTNLLYFLGSATVWLPLACWGIAAFMTFQYANFGDALGFFHTQQNFGQRPVTGYLEQWGRALALEPIWSVYVPSSPAYWAGYEQAPGDALFSLSFANPIYFVASVALVGVGWHKGWLNGREVVLAALVLGIPYLTHSYRCLMLSQGRFAAVAFPVYLVLGRLMARAPAPLVAAGCVLSGFLLAVYAALFAAGYQMN
jgi:hypothetical protein